MLSKSTACDWLKTCNWQPDFQMGLGGFCTNRTKFCFSTLTGDVARQCSSNFFNSSHLKCKNYNDFVVTNKQKMGLVVN